MNENTIVGLHLNVKALMHATFDQRLKVLCTWHIISDAFDIWYVHFSLLLKPLKKDTIDKQF